MTPRLLAATAALLFGAGIAAADPFTDRIVADLTGQGFTFIDIKNGLSQVKVEAVRGTDKLEVVFDRTTGSILKQEMEPAEADEIGRTGVRIRDRARDFVRDVPGTGTPGVVAPPVAPAPGPGTPPAVPGETVVSAQALVNELAAQGFTFFEVKNGPTQTKVEAIRGTEEVEIVFDRATGDILKQEAGAADPEAVGRTGLEVDTRNRDFLRIAGAVSGRGGSGDDSGSGDASTSGGSDDSSGSGSSGSGSSTSGSESSNSGSGSSNSGSGSSNSGSGSSNSGSGSSNSGSGSSNSGSGSDD